VNEGKPLPTGRYGMFGSPVDAELPKTGLARTSSAPAAALAVAVAAAAAADDQVPYPPIEYPT